MAPETQRFRPLGLEQGDSYGGGDPRGRDGASGFGSDGTPFTLDPQTLAELAMVLAGRPRKQQSAGAGQQMGSLGGMPGWSGAPQPTSWNPNRAQPTQPPATQQRAVSQRPTENSAARTAATERAQPNALQGDDKRTAAFIDQYLAKKGSPAAGAKQPTAGEMMVQAGRQHKVDPMVLLSIAGHETGFGKKGVGLRKMLGVSAYDRNPGNVNPRFDGLRNQIFKGASTFARLRKKGGASENSPIASQLSAANRAGWATDRNWHRGVGRMHSSITNEAQRFQPAGNATNVRRDPATSAPDVSRVDTSSIPGYAGLTPRLQEAAREARAMGLRVTSTTGGRHAARSYHYQGRAIDVAGTPAQMRQFFDRYARTSPAELFYDPRGGIKHGRSIGAIGGHGNHVHLAY